jgi:hypothetical protein
MVLHMHQHRGMLVFLIPELMLAHARVVTHSFAPALLAGCAQSAREQCAGGSASRNVVGNLNDPGPARERVRVIRVRWSKMSADSLQLHLSI